MIKPNYKKAQSTEFPKTLDMTSAPGKVFIRRNITEIKKDEITYYEYEEAKLTVEEYEEYEAEISGPFITTIMQALSEVQLQIDELSL